MPLLLDSGQQTEDLWVVLPRSDTPADQTIPDGKVLIHLASWEAQRDELKDRASEIGVWLDSDDEPERLATEALSLPVLAVNFPVFSDGRGYSIARLIRERLGYTGDLLAIGDVLVDQLFYMKRCGINQFRLRSDQKTDAAVAALSTFSDNYQSSVEQPLPLFRRRPA